MAVPPEFSFSLSLAAVDLMWEQLRLGTPVRIFEVPSVGATAQDRDRLRRIVFDDLASRDLAYRGRLDPRVEEALGTLSRFQVAIDAAAMLDQHERLLARSAANGRSTVLARLRKQTITFDVLRPEALLAQTVGLIGDEKPGPGRSVTFPDVEPPRPVVRRSGEEGFSGVFDERPTGGGYEVERRAAQTMWEKPRKRAGMFTVYGRDRLGREVSGPVLTWFDTEDGRYFGHVRPGPDGKRWTTYAPGDAGRVAQQLAGLLDAAGRASTSH